MKEKLVPQEYVVEDTLGPVVLYGEIISQIRHQNGVPGAPMRERWTDMTLYRVLDPNSKYRYAVHVVGRSIVYHRNDTPCAERKVSRWLRDTVKNISLQDPERYKYLVPCRTYGCRPGELENLPDETVVAVETDDHKLLIAPAAKLIVRSFYTEYGKIGSLAADLIRDAASKDQHIRKALSVPRRLGS
jgi:hypothetical protein